MTAPGTKSPKKGATSFTAALIATAARLRGEAGLPAEKDLTAAAALVLAMAVTRMVQAAPRQAPPDEAEAAAAQQREAIVAACVLQIGARSLAAAAATEGWPLAHDALAAEAGRAVFGRMSREMASRVVANGAQTLAAMASSRHPRAAELKKQIEACFTLYARTGEPKAITALALLYESLRGAARV